MKKNLEENMELKWKHPFTCILAGPTSCGKSTFCGKFINFIEHIIDKPISEVIYCSPIVDQYNLISKSVKYVDVIPEIESFSDKKNRLLILDDMMREANFDVVDLFTKFSHHYNLSVVFLTQNIFNQGKGRRDISLNAHYIVCFKNPRDRQQISFLSKQVSPSNPKFITEAFNDATSTAYGYLVLDLTQSTADELRYRTHIFPDDKPFGIVYVRK
jgi:hypothetical protein